MNANGYNILLYQSNESKKHQAKGIDTFLQSRVDGIIASVTLDTDNNDDAYQEIKKRNTPLVFFDRILETMPVSSVTIDDYKGGFIATEHLIKQGYRRILHITAEQNLSIFKERLLGYMDALEHYGIPVDEKLVVKGNFSLEFGRNIVKELLAEGCDFDAVFALEDYTAMGVMQQLMESGIKIPEQVGVIGFANEAFGSLVTPQLSTIAQQTITMGEEAARLFLELNKQEKTNPSPKKVILEPILIVRSSSKRLGE